MNKLSRVIKKNVLIIWIFLCAFVGYVIFATASLILIPTEQYIKWMEDHDKLSGWAQFVGATLALLLAIFVPAWQRYWQNLDRERDGANSELGLAISSYFLISEIKNHLTGYKTLAQQPRAIARNSVAQDDLLRRIHALEIREMNTDRLSRLFRARGALLIADAFVNNPRRQDQTLDHQEVTQIDSLIEYLERAMIEADNEQSIAFDERARINLWWLARVAYRIVRWGRS